PWAVTGSSRSPTRKWRRHGRRRCWTRSCGWGSAIRRSPRRSTRLHPGLANDRLIGFSMSFTKHPCAIVETIAVGEGTQIDAFAHILPGASIGADCRIGGHTFVQNDVVVGDRVTVEQGVQLWDGVTLENDVFVGPNATFTNRGFEDIRELQRTVVR